MDILIYLPGGAERAQSWVHAIGPAFPEARLRVWTEHDRAHADYALVWAPPPAVLRDRPGLKAVLYLGAGVDALVDALAREPGMLSPQVPVFRLEDAGMGEQMAEYCLHALLRYARRFDDYADQQQRGEWAKLQPHPIADFSVGIMGFGVLGQHVAARLRATGFPVRCWSRERKTMDGIESFAGPQEMAAFLSGTRAIVNLLPLTGDTEDILCAKFFDAVDAGTYLINIARGRHLVEDDLLAALASGRIAAATLDVFRTEPLPPGHPFWTAPRVTVTPHICALSLSGPSTEMVIEQLRALRDGREPRGRVDLNRGY